MTFLVRMCSRVALAIVVAACGRSTPTSALPVGVSTIQEAVIVREPLSAWTPGPAKQAIVDFVMAVSAPGSPRQLPENERIAVFDDDGTLWPERPLAEAAFVVARLKTEVVEQPTLVGQEPYRSVLAQGVEGLTSLGRAAVLEAIARTHSGMTDERFEAEAREFFANAKHPRFGVPYPELAYRPMRELLAYLGEHGFTVYLCTAGDENFVRAHATPTYGIVRERIIGSSFRKELVVENDRAVLKRRPEIFSYNDKEEKVLNIERRIGRRPVLAVGTVRSAGDIAMLTYVRKNGGPSSLALVINHDDPVRELAYAEPHGETLAAARERGFTVVSMRTDWVDIFGTQPAARAPRGRHDVQTQ